MKLILVVHFHFEWQSCSTSQDLHIFGASFFFFCHCQILIIHQHQSFSFNQNHKCLHLINRQIISMLLQRLRMSEKVDYHSPDRRGVSVSVCLCHLCYQLWFHKAWLTMIQWLHAGDGVSAVTCVRVVMLFGIILSSSSSSWPVSLSKNMEKSARKGQTVWGCFLWGHCGSSLWLCRYFLKSVIHTAYILFSTVFNGSFHINALCKILLNIVQIGKYIWIKFVYCHPYPGSCLISECFYDREELFDSLRYPVITGEIMLKGHNQ